jgi:hypothetical protein
MEIDKCEICKGKLILSDCYSIAGHYCIVDNYKCDEDHHSHKLCECCEEKINRSWNKKQKRYKNNKNQQKQYLKQSRIEQWIDNETQNKYYQTTIVKGKKISIYLKKNYGIQFRNNNTAKQIINIREGWFWANEYDQRTGETPTIYTHPYHCFKCLRPLKYSQTIQLLNKISCKKCKDSISEFLYYKFNS